MGASLNQGKSANGTNNSSTPSNSQKPCRDTLVTSASEVLLPSAVDVMFVFLDQVLNGEVDDVLSFAWKRLHHPQDYIHSNRSIQDPFVSISLCSFDRREQDILYSRTRQRIVLWETKNGRSILACLMIHKHHRVGHRLVHDTYHTTSIICGRSILRVSCFDRLQV